MGRIETKPRCTDCPALIKNSRTASRATVPRLASPAAQLYRLRRKRQQQPAGCPFPVRDSAGHTGVCYRRWALLLSAVTSLKLTLDSGSHACCSLSASMASAEPPAAAPPPPPENGTELVSVAVEQPKAEKKQGAEYTADEVRWRGVAARSLSAQHSGARLLACAASRPAWAGATSVGCVAAAAVGQPRRWGRAPLGSQAKHAPSPSLRLEPRRTTPALTRCVSATADVCRALGAVRHCD